MVHPTKLQFDEMLEDLLGKRLVGRPAQGIYDLSTLQNYEIGSRLQLPGPEIFRYAQIAGVDALGGRAVANLSTDEEITTATVASAIGTFLVTITVVAAAGLAANELQGGYLCYKKTRYYRHRIVSHPAAVNGATCVLTLKTPIVGHAIAIGDTLIAYHNPWAAVGHGATYGSGVSFVGWPFGDIAIGQYTWVQTWGAVNGAPSVFYGDNPNMRQVYFASDGSLTTFDAAATQHDSGYQRAGFWMPCNFYGGVLNAMEDGGHLFMLQICP